MTGTLIAVLLLVAPPSEGGELPAATAESAELIAVPPRTGVELREAVPEALRRWAKPDDEHAEKAAVDFLRLYDELGRDDALATSQREYFQTKVRSRLLDLSEQISKRIAREIRLAKNEDKHEARRAPPASVDLPDGKGEPLAQNVAVPGFAAGFGRQVGPGGDYGPQLVELIQRTIAPRSWDVNGGPGSIYYWQPGRAIVVRQMDAVHDDIGNLLRQLERANR
jgi:hypothetical protein